MWIIQHIYNLGIIKMGWGLDKLNVRDVYLLNFLLEKLIITIQNCPG